MAKQKRGSNSRGRNNDPNQDVQPWLGWIAAMLVVVIVVVAVAMGMERTNNQRNATAEVRMTPLVGGIQVPVATEPGTAVAEAAEVTPIPENTAAITGSGTVTMVTVITTTEEVTGTDATSDTFLITGEMTPTVEGDVRAELTVTPTESIIATVTVTSTEDAVTEEPTATDEATPEETVTDEPTDSAAAETETPTGTATSTSTSTLTATPTATEAVTPTATATVAPTATPQPTATSASVGIVFEIGETLTASNGRVELHADASDEAMVLESVGPGVELEVMAPSGDFSEYPVVVDGIGWVRVRAADGLVGWVQADLVEGE